MPPTPTTHTIHPAAPSNLPSLTTIVPRAFHPTNSYIRALVPDTPKIRQWWLGIFTSKLATPETSHLLVAVAATDEEAGSSEETLGVLSMQLVPASEPGAGFWSSVPPTSDHDMAAYGDVGSSISDARLKLMTSCERSEHIEQSKQDQQYQQTQQTQHFVIELFGVDHASKGLGLGKKLLLQACSIADEAGMEIFVMANASAKGVYQHPEVGFEIRDVKVMPGEERYEEFMLVRPARGRG
jgi:ribosomal protein S18 acetylase RimI-like enzyme